MTNTEPPPRRRTCGASEVYFRHLETVPGFRERQIALELFTARSAFFGGAVRQAGPMQIPVVVHVVYNDPSENISDAQIESQIGVLNQDYRATNTDRAQIPAVWENLVADANIEFQLATADPAGDATTGISRTSTNLTTFSTDETIKSLAKGGAAPWPSDAYLNIWVCNLGGGLLGYAQFPGGPAETDGVVIRYTAFGTTGTVAAPFHLGRTTTHEVGHWLNLIHIWGDTNNCSGSDQVDDTPMQQLPNYNKPTFPLTSCQNGPNGDMFMNYMDYVDDDTMIMLTEGQVQRIAATFAGPRAALVGP